jgi:transcriptional regulator with XRE-family HTH domain
MSGFSDRLREQISYLDLTQKEVAAGAGIKKRALDMYLGSQQSLPRADIAVKLAKTLNVTVEYLVNGNNSAADPKKQDGFIGELQKQNDFIRSRPEFQSLLRKIEELDEKKQKAVFRTVKFLIDQLKSISPSTD